MRRNPREDPGASNRQDQPTRQQGGGQPGRQQSQQPPTGMGQQPAGPPPSGQSGQVPPGYPPQQRQPPQAQPGQPPAQMHPPQKGMGSQQQGGPPPQGGQPMGGQAPQGVQPTGGGQPMQGAQTGQQPGPVAGVRPRLRPESVEEIVQTDVITAERDTPVATVVAKMAEEEVGSVVIVEDDSPVGIVTDRTVALALEELPDVSERPVEEIMVGDLVTTTTDATIFDVIHTLGDAGIRRLPVVDEDGRLAGIVTLDDVIVVLTAELENAAEIISAQIPRL